LIVCFSSSDILRYVVSDLVVAFWCRCSVVVDESLTT